MMNATRPVRCGLLLAVVMGLLMSGCMLGPDYKRPEMALDGAYRTSGALVDTAASVADLPWWQVFDDPMLATLITEALENNRDLRAAVARVDAARGVRAQVRAPLFPQIGYGAGVSRGQNEFLGNPSPSGRTGSSALVDINVAWEIDLWGRVRRADEAAMAFIFQNEQVQRGLMLSIVSEVAASWFTLIGLDQQIQVTRNNVATFAQTEQLFEDRAQGGVSSDLPVLRAKALKSQAQAAVPELERRRFVLENALCVLVGRQPGSILRSQELPDLEPPVIPAGVPSELLERRPDIQQAEAVMRQTSAAIGVATADFFPRIGLTMIYGQATPDLTNFSSSTWNLWSLAAQLAGPVFTGGFLTGQLNQAQAEFVASVAAYEQTVLTALADTSSALNDKLKLDEAAVYQQVRVSSLQQAVSMAQVRYDLGRASYFEVLDAQQQLFPAELALTETRTDQLVTFARIYRALGGGWNLATDAWQLDSEASSDSGEATTAARGR